MQRRLQSLAHLAAITIAGLSGTQAQGQPAAGDMSLAEFESFMAETGAYLDDLSAALDRSAFDLDALLDSLDFDADPIIEFAKTELAYEQYPGVLRGPLGTLFSRSGNAIDQALLLAGLLRDAGYDVRIAQTELSAEAAQDVLRAMQQPAPAAPPIGDPAGTLAVMQAHDLVPAALGADQAEGLLQYIRTAPEASAADIYGTVSSTTEFVLDELGNAGAQFDTASVNRELVEEARQYHWVQYRDQAGDPWIDIHPVFIGELPFAPPTPTAYISGQVPESLQHRLRFQVFIERKTGNRLEVVPVSEPWERPVANLVGVPLTFSNLTDSALQGGSIGRGLNELLESAAFFAPAFGNSLAEGGQFFDLRGTLIDPLVAQGGGTALFATIGDAFAGALGEIGGETEIPTLTAQWMEFTLIAPDGSEQVYRRTTFDRIGGAARAQNAPPADLPPTSLDDVQALMRRNTFMVAAGSVPRGYVIEAAHQRFQEQRAVIEALMRVRLGAPAPDVDATSIPAGWAGHLSLFSVFDMAQSIGPGHRNYRSGTALVIHSDGLTEDGTWSEWIDIVSNPRRTVSLEGDTPTLDPRYALESGVWETAVEGTPLAEGTSFDTWQAFAAAEASGARPVVLLPEAPLPNADLPADTRAAIEADLSRGYAVIVPSAVASPALAGWWRVDLRTGETLGQLRDGRGQDFVEMVGLLFSFGSFAYAASGCDQTEQTSAYVCCLGINTAGLLIGLHLGLPFVMGVMMDVGSAAWPTLEVCEGLL